MRLFQNQDLNEVLGKNLIENQERHHKPHWESRTSPRTSSKLKILGKTSWIEILIEILNEDFFLIENLNENFNEVLSNILIFDEVLRNGARVFVAIYCVTNCYWQSAISR